MNARVGIHELSKGKSEWRKIQAQAAIPALYVRGLHQRRCSCEMISWLCVVSSYLFAYDDELSPSRDNVHCGQGGWPVCIYDAAGLRGSTLLE